METPSYIPNIADIGSTEFPADFIQLMLINMCDALMKLIGHIFLSIIWFIGERDEIGLALV